MSLDYTKVTHESLLQDWNNRLLADDRFKELSQASIYQYLQESIANIADLSNYYQQRTFEENYLDTARLDSSVIKLCHNLGYQPNRPIPATAEMAINLRGPLPSTLKIGDTIWFNNQQLVFSYGGHDYILDACYSYTFTARDIREGADSGWTKKILYSKRGDNDPSSSFLELNGTASSVDAAKLNKIKLIQGAIKKVVLDGITYSSQVGDSYQEYDIDDLQFSNYYGKRDPFTDKNGSYEKRYGICKVGIGQDENSAFLPENLYTIEDHAVELSDEYKEDSTEPLNIVCIKSNYDKTVQLSFGDGTKASRGLTSTDDRIYVQYLSTDGSDANYQGAKDTQLTVNGKIVATGAGRVINLSNYVTFTFNSDVTGGTDFESKGSMKRNAAVYAASHGVLITPTDFQSYFHTISDPIKVKYSNASGEQDREDDSISHNKNTSNIVSFTIASDIYRYTNGVYAPINVFDEDEDLSSMMLYPDYSQYMEHLPDYVTYLVNPKLLVEDQSNGSTTFDLNVQNIQTDIADRVYLNTEIASLPPIYHYFDVVGDILIDRNVDMADLKLDLENSIYEWIAEETSFNSPIYKSDLIKKILDHDGALRASIDIKVSELIKSGTKSYRFNAGSFSAKNYTLVIPAYDTAGNSMVDVMEEYEDGTIQIQSIDNSSDPVSRMVSAYTYDDDNVYLTFTTTAPSVNSEYPLKITLSDKSFYTKGNITSVDSKIVAATAAWISEKGITVGTSSRPYELPYTIAEEMSSSDLIVRSETFERRGANTVSVNTSLSEYSFYNMLANLVDNDISTIEEVQESFNNLYPILKPIFDDNVLDDNNNIVNFGSKCEIPVIRLYLRYKYAE